MSEKILIEQCSPTLAAIKTGSMFLYPYASIGEMRAAVRSWNKRLREKGLRVLPLRYNGRNALIYIYRPYMLLRDLQNKTAYSILKRQGYGMRTPEGCIAQLARRMSTNSEFPHEVGLFLGYPPDDVNGFIENKGGKCKCVGCWKVYTDADSAGKTFAKYKKCTSAYKEQFAKGQTIERLTVAD